MRTIRIHQEVDGGHKSTDALDINLLFDNKNWPPQYTINTSQTTIHVRNQ